MSQIAILDPLVANKIAAGEVVERPAAVVKELVENAIDAGATQIYVEIQSGGKKLIRITDNGKGIAPDELSLAFERHATSKVTHIEDIYALTTLGFRGEALASIAAVSHVEMTSKQAAQDMGQRIKISGGRVVEDGPVGSQDGSTIVVKDLFYNTPARMKFMKSTAAETGAISDLMIRLALSHNDICFTYVVDQKHIFKTPGDGDTYKVIYAVLDKELAQNLVPVAFEQNGWKLTGFLSKLSFTRGNRGHQIFFVNQRFIRSKMLLDAVTGAYLGQLPIGRFPSAILHLEVPPDEVDVNIHPAKTEVKFHQEMILKDWLMTSLRQTIRSFNQIPEIASIKYRQEAGGAAVFGAKAAPGAEAAPNPVESHRGQAFYQERQSPASASVPASSAASEAAAAPVSAPVSAAAPTTPSAAVSSAKAPLYEQRPKPEVPAEKPFDVSLLSHLKMSDLVKEAPQTPVPEQTTFIKTSEGLYDDLIYIGQIFNAYLLFQKHGQLYVIDQHAGHEKVLYEKFKAEMSQQTMVRQILAKPILMTYNHSEWTAIMAEVEKMAQIGFVYEAFGDLSIVIREVPLAFHTPGTETFFRELVDSLGRLKLSSEDIWKERIIKAACKAAIKANDAMDAFEVKKLLADLKDLEDPYTCPHGRPIIVTITQAEFEKMFKRT